MDRQRTKYGRRADGDFPTTAVGGFPRHTEKLHGEECADGSDSHLRQPDFVAGQSIYKRQRYEESRAQPTILFHLPAMAFLSIGRTHSFKKQEQYKCSHSMA